MNTGATTLRVTTGKPEGTAPGDTAQRTTEQDMAVRQETTLVAATGMATGETRLG